RHGPHDFEEFALCRLNFQAHLEDGLCIGARTAIQNGAFAAINGNQRIVDAHAAERRGHMFNGGDADAVAQIKRGAKRGAANPRKMHLDRRRCGAVFERAANDITTIGRRRPDRQIDRLPAMHPVAREVDGGREGTLARIQFLHTRNTPTPARSPEVCTSQKKLGAKAAPSNVSVSVPSQLTVLAQECRNLEALFLRRRGRLATMRIEAAMGTFGWRGNAGSPCAACLYGATGSIVISGELRRLLPVSHMRLTQIQA